MSATPSDIEKMGNLPVTPCLILHSKFIILDMSAFCFNKTKLMLQTDTSFYYQEKIHLNVPHTRIHLLLESTYYKCSMFDLCSVFQVFS